MLRRAYASSPEPLLFAHMIWASSWENLFLPYANNKDADQPAHPRSLLSAFVVRCLDSIIPLFSISEISSLYLASVAEQAGLSLPRSQTPKTGFLMTRLIYGPGESSRQRTTAFWPFWESAKHYKPHDSYALFSQKTNLCRLMTKPTKWLCVQRRLRSVLIRVFAVRMKKAWVLSYPLSAQRRLWSDWADAQADLSLRWAHTHFVGFVMSRLNLCSHRILFMSYNIFLTMRKNSQNSRLFYTVSSKFQGNIIQSLTT